MNKTYTEWFVISLREILWRCIKKLRGRSYVGKPLQYYSYCKQFNNKCRLNLESCVDR